MKKIPLILLSLAILAAGFSGCGSAPVSSSSEALPAAAPTETPVPAPTAAQPNPYVEGYDPLTGETTDAGEHSRPIAVMVQNDLDSYPQWGIKSAKVVVEALTEGSTTGMMCIFSGEEGLPEKVGGVGPARDLFWQLALPMNSILMNIDSNIYASNLLNAYQYQNLDGRYAGVTCFDLDYEKDITANHEYCWFTNQQLMEAGLELYDLPSEGDRHSFLNFAAAGTEQPVPTEPAATGEPAATPSPAEEKYQPHEATRIEITFAEDNTIPLLYNDEEGKWEKYDTHWQPQVDGTYPEEAEDSEKILQFDNVLVLYCSAGIKDDGYTRNYDLSQGTGLYLNGASCQLIRWQKGGISNGITLYDAGGNLFPAHTGKTYVAIYGGFDGQDIMVQNSASEKLTLWDAPEAITVKENTPEETPEAPEPPEESESEDQEPDEEEPDEDTPEEGNVPSQPTADAPQDIPSAPVEPPAGAIVTPEAGAPIENSMPVQGEIAG